MFVSAIIAAGGRGQRVGDGRPKQLLSIGGRSILERSVSAFLTHPSVDEVVVPLPPEIAANPPDCLRHAVKPVHAIAGGPRRQDSVANAFRAIDQRAELVVVHDAARPFVSADLIGRTIAAAAEAGAALAALPARDTIKRASEPSSAAGTRHVAETLARDVIYLAQTPQAFRRDVLRSALVRGETDGMEATDEATLAERAGHPVRLVEGESSNIKITTAEDLAMAEAIAARDGARPARTGRAGTGYDLHRLAAGRRLVLGGVVVPSDRGALGHSDADVVCHAVTDAVLGAAGLGDIGRHFPDSDPQWAGASSLDLLARAVAMVEAEGLQVGNVDVTVVLEAPKIRDYIDAMRAELARVSIKGKTNEGMDAVGRGEAVAAHAVALLRRR